MANKKISQLTEVTNPNATDVIPVVNASETKKTQLGNLPISDATQSALDGKQDTLGYTAENVANRSTDVDADKTSLTKYPVVKAVYDWAVSLFATISQLNTKQDTLVSGTNIKTINSTSLLGSGDIAIDLSPISVDGDKVSIAADSTATTQTTAVIQATDTNSGIAIVPNGTGAFTLNVPDGTAVGGNARGQYAVDLQRVRNNADQVAAGGYSVIVGGFRNRTHTNNYGFIGGGYENIASGNYSVIAGGNNNNVSGFNAAAICGGSSNTASGVLSFIGGGRLNTVSSNYSTTSGGQENTASTNTHATVVGGYQNSSTGQYSVSGGYSNVASGEGSVALGYDNTASGTRSVAMGSGNTASGTRSVAMGESCNASGSISVAMGRDMTASGLYSVAMGDTGSASGSYSVALGFVPRADATKSIALGRAQTEYYGEFATGVDHPTFDPKFSIVQLSKKVDLTSGQTVSLAVDGNSSTTLGITGNNMYNFNIEFIGIISSTSGTVTGVSQYELMTQSLKFASKKIGGGLVNSTSLNIIDTNGDSSITSTASLSILDISDTGIAVQFTAPTFTGGGTINMNLCATLQFTKLSTS